MRTTRFYSVCILALAIIISTFIFSSAIRHRNDSNNVISVTGLAEHNFESDLIVWKSQYTVKNMDLKAAYTELKTQGIAIGRFLESKGIAKSEMTFSAIEIFKEYSQVRSGNNFTSAFDGYRLSQQVSITSGRVSKIEQISREITELINRGIEITSLAPEYYYTKLSDLKIKMLAEAAKDGYTRAKTIAENGEGKLGSLTSSSMGVFQIVAQNSSENYSWGGSFNTSSKKKTATVTVRLQYQVK